MVYSVIALFLGIAGAVANTFKYRWCFLLWIPANSYWIAYNLIKEEYMMALVFLVYFSLSIVGWFTWKKD